VQTTHNTNPSVADLARLVNCLDEHGFATLAGVKVSTLDAWRKRGKGPEYVLLGRNYLYPIAAVESHLSTLIRTRSASNPADRLM
jgi:hypothetical protein